MVILVCALLRLILLWVEERNSFSTIFYKFVYETTRNICLLGSVRKRVADMHYNLEMPNCDPLKGYACVKC